MGSTSEQLLGTAAQYPDFVVLGAVFALLLTYGLVRGVKELSELALAVPVTVFAYSVLVRAGVQPAGVASAVVVAVMFVGSVFVVSRHTSGLDDNRQWGKVTLAALGTLGLLLLTVLDFIDISEFYTFSAIPAYLSHQFAHPILLALSLLALALSRKV